MDPLLANLAPSAFDNAYHVGVLVPDLVGAMARIARQLQLTWSEPFELNSGFEAADGRRDDRPVRIAYSQEGPPFLEIIEVVDHPGSIFSQPAGGGFHHLGVYAESWRDEVERLVGEGFVLERRGAGVAFLIDPSLGLRIEVVSFKGRDFLTRILSGDLGREFPLSERRPPT